MHIILLLTLFTFIINLNCFPSSSPEGIEELNTEQVRQITRCMVAFHEETLESVTISLKPDRILSDFFLKKKGKKYKVSKGKCSLGRLKLFATKLQDDITEMTTDKDGLISIRDKFAARTITAIEFDEALESYGIYDREKLASWISFFNSHTEKLATVKSHVEALIAVTIPLSVTLETAWEYFKSHRDGYLPGITDVEIAGFKPRFFAHVSEYYGLE